jgi:3-hydroxyisobutyrate dehydrogenase
MGYGMATNIRKKLSNKSTMYINDVNSEACQRFSDELKSHGPIEIVKTAKEAATKAPILVSIVPAAEHVKQVYLDKENGVIAAPPSKERLILDSSTIDVDSQREVGKAIRDAGIGSYYDSPVSVSFNWR